MPDFGPRWKYLGEPPIGKGGHSQVYPVSDSENPEGPRRAAKILNKGKLTAESQEWKRLEAEIEISKTFDHPNVIRVIDSGYTAGSGYPFFVMPLYSGGSLQEARIQFGSPAKVFSLFSDICEGVAYIHGKGVLHRDIKPANVFVDAGHGIAGDLGLCFRLDADSLTEPMEVATARWFGAPELRDGHLPNPLPCADVYSLGKVLYWLFTGKVYDRDEQAYDVPDHKLAHILAQSGIDITAGIIDDRLIHAGAFADEIVSLTVRYRPSDRIQLASELATKVRQMIARFESGGRALDLDLPLRCMFCGNGNYEPVVKPIDSEARTALPDQGILSSHRPNRWADMQSQANNALGQAFLGRGGDTPVPLNLVCNYCGNMQIFRWDRVQKALGRWKP